MRFFPATVLHYCFFSIILLSVHIGRKTSPGTAYCRAAALQNFTVIDFLADVRRLHSFENVLLLRNRNASIARPFISAAVDDSAANATVDENQFVIGITSDLQVPVLQMDELASFYMKSRFSELMMTVVYLEGAWSDHSGLLKQLVLDLRHMTTSKVLFLLDYAEVDEGLLVRLFRYCWQNKMINVVALFAGYQNTATFYSYTPFPEFQIETKSIFVDVINRKDIYPYRLGNLKGYKLPYILGGSDPRIIVYLKPDGEMDIKGFVGHFLEAFERKYNCSLIEPLPAKINAFAPAQELVAAVRNGTVDISAGLTFPSIPMVGYTYPYEQLNWCLMIPVESDVPFYEFYVMVFELSAFLITLSMILLLSIVLSRAMYQHGYTLHLMDLIINDDCLRGALGQPFLEVINAPRIIRFIYLQICILGILLTTTYNSYFATYVTSAPKVPPLLTFDDILYSGLKVYAWQPEYNELLGRVAEFKKYTLMFHLEPNYQKYLEMRDSFNTKYGYMVPTTKWTIINEQQRVFTTPIFRRRDDLCFFNNVPMGFPVHENSIFMQTLYELTLETAQSGLTDQWRLMGFLEMIDADKLSFTDLSEKREFKAMQAGDLYYIWCGLGIMVGVVGLVFLIELCVYNRHKFGGFMKAWCRRICGKRKLVK